MNLNEYKEKREKLLRKAEELINNGDFKGFEAVEKEVKEMDADYEKTAKYRANFRALQDNQEAKNPLLDGNNREVFREGRGVYHPSFLTAEYQTDDGRLIKAYRKKDYLVADYPNTEGMSLGKYLRGAITGDWSGATAEMDAFKALSTATTQVLIPQVLSAQVIDLARNKSVLFRSGAPMIPMETNNLTISRVKTDPSFTFKAEGAEVTESTMEFEGVQLKTKTAYGLMSITLEAMNSSANLESVVTNAMAESLAQLIDSKCLLGTTADEPKGILTYSEINTLSAGEITGYGPFVQGVGLIKRANGEPTTWVVNAATDEALNLLTDTNGNPLGIPQAVASLERLVSNQLPDNDGDNQDESVSMIYNPEAVVIGLQLPLAVEVSREALDAWKKGLVYLRVYAMVDVALLRPKWVTRIDGIKAAPQAA